MAVAGREGLAGMTEPQTPAGARPEEDRSGTRVPSGYRSDTGSVSVAAAAPGQGAASRPVGEDPQGADPAAGTRPTPDGGRAGRVAPRPAELTAPVEYAVAVDRYLAAAALGEASRRVYRIALTTWAWALVGARRRAAGCGGARLLRRFHCICWTPPAPENGSGRRSPRVRPLSEPAPPTANCPHWSAR